MNSKLTHVEMQCSAVMVATLLLISACGTTGPTTDNPQDGGSGVTTNPVVVDGVVGENVSPDSIAGRAPQDRTIYFDFDNAEVRPEYLSIVAEHGRYLAANPEGRVRLEGHTDERGTREYNIALGEFRSKSVARMLQLQGVSAAQLRSISFGEELPAQEGQGPSAWELNRRVNIVYETE